MLMNLHHLPKKRYGTRRYFPVFAILAAVATLILLLLFYTSRNLALARQRLENSLFQEGLILTRSIEAGSRAGMRMHWRLNQLQTLIEEIGNTPKVAYISVIDTDGTILAHTQPDKIDTITELDLQTLKKEQAEVFTRTLVFETTVEVFDIVTRISPSPTPGPEQSSLQPGMGRRRGQMAGIMGNGHGLTDVAFIQIGMRMDELIQLQKRDMRNAIFMLVVLSVVGSAALYFIVFIQNYYAVNHAFQTMQSYTQHVVDSMANGLISLNTDDKIVTMNRQARHILNIPPCETIEGRPLHDVMTFHDVDLLASLSKNEALIERELQCVNASQTTVPISLSASTLTDDDGNQAGTVLLFRDLSDVKALQDQVKRAERLASLGKLAAGVAHEIRNPLGSLKGFLQYFQRKLKLEGQDKTYLTVMVNEVDRLNAVISNLLEFSRPKVPERKPADIAELIRHVLMLVDSDLQAKQLKISLEIAENLPLVSLDRDQLTQVLLNMLLNAIHATDAGGQIRIWAHIQKQTQQLELSLNDTGQGIAADDLSKVFDPFFSTKKQGTGLGLAIAHTIIEHHRGEILVESTQGQGTTFQIRLPIS